MSSQQGERKLLRLEVKNSQTPIEKKPEWIKTTAKMGPEYKSMHNLVQEKNLQDRVNMEMTQRGLVVRFTGQILFEVGEAEIRNEGRDVLDKVATVLKEMPNNVMIEGHTDNLPIDTEEFPTNWELSTARATEVIKYFIEDPGINPKKLSAAGYSKYRPIKPNDSPENRALNRRVEVVILNTTNGQQGRDRSG